MVYIQTKQANHTFTITFSKNNNYLNVPGTKSYVQHKDFLFLLGLCYIGDQMLQFVLGTKIAYFQVYPW